LSEIWGLAAVMLWLVANGGLLAGIAPCSVHGSLMIGANAASAMQMPMTHRGGHGSAPAGHHDGCDCGGRCGAPSVQAALLPAQEVFAASYDAIAIIPPFVSAPAARNAVILPPSTGPPDFLDA